MLHSSTVSMTMGMGVSVGASPSALATDAANKVKRVARMPQRTMRGSVSRRNFGARSRSGAAGGAEWSGCAFVVFMGGL